eukprot:UN02016
MLMIQKTDYYYANLTHTDYYIGNYEDGYHDRDESFVIIWESQENCDNFYQTVIKCKETSMTGVYFSLCQTCSKRHSSDDSTNEEIPKDDEGSSSNNKDSEQMYAVFSLGALGICVSICCLCCNVTAVSGRRRTSMVKINADNTKSNREGRSPSIAMENPGSDFEEGSVVIEGENQYNLFMGEEGQPCTPVIIHSAHEGEFL